MVFSRRFISRSPVAETCAALAKRGRGHAFAVICESDDAALVAGGHAAAVGPRSGDQVSDDGLFSDFAMSFPAVHLPKLLY